MRDECTLFQGLGTPTGFGQGLDLGLVAACTLGTMTARDRCRPKPSLESASCDFALESLIESTL